MCFNGSGDSKNGCNQLSCGYADCDNQGTCEGEHEQLTCNQMICGCALCDSKGKHEQLIGVFIKQTNQEINDNQSDRAHNTFHNEQESCDSTKCDSQGTREDDHEQSTCVFTKQTNQRAKDNNQSDRAYIFQNEQESCDNTCDSKGTCEGEHEQSTCVSTKQTNQKNNQSDRAYTFQNEQESCDRKVLNGMSIDKDSQVPGRDEHLAHLAANCDKQGISDSEPYACTYTDWDDQSHSEDAPICKHAKHANPHSQRAGRRENLAHAGRRGNFDGEQLSCMYTNSDSLINKFDELKDRIKEENPDIIGITEVLPKNSRYIVEKSELNMEEYDIFPESFPRNSNRGVLLYVRKNLKATELKLKSEFREQVAVKVKYNNTSLTVGCLYRSPNSTNENNSSLLEVINELNQIKGCDNLMIFGDFNFPNINWETATGKSQESNEFIMCMKDNYLVQHVSKPTRSRIGQEANILDLILTTDERLVDYIDYSAPLGASDHCILNFKLNCGRPAKDKRTSRRNFFKADYNAIRDDLRAVNWSEKLYNLELDEMVKTFNSCLNSVIDEHVPIPTEKTMKGSITLSESTRKTIKRKNRMWTRYMESRSPNRYREYCKARNKVRSLVRKERCEKEKKIAETAKVNPKKFWSYVNSKRKCKTGIAELHTKIGNHTIVSSQDKDKAETLAEFFGSVFTKESEENMPNLEPSVYGTKSDDRPFTEADILKVLKELNPAKAPGPDDMHPKFLKEVADLICKPLEIIFNKSFKEGKVPTSWKEGHISAIFKKGDKTQASNYRPVSLTSVIVKLFEKLVRERIMDHMEINDLISYKQFGFVAGRSTTLQLLKVIDDWVDVLDEGGEIHCIYMDFMKAFDKVPHKRLITKLQAYGISNQTCNWIKDFLNNRRQRVCVNGEASRWHPVTSGIPQGSVLGPTLFVLFINDLPSTVRSEAVLFADDTKLFRTIMNDRDIQVVQEDLDRLVDWSDTWLLKFHPDKCKVLKISNNPNREASYTMRRENGERVVLEESTVEKDIGVHVDQRLKFEKHILQQTQKANQIMGLIRRSFVNLTERNFVQLFKSLVRPHLEYCNSVWCPHLVKHIDAIEKVQRRGTKMLPGYQELTYEERLQKLKLPTLVYRRNRGDMIEVFKILKGFYDTRVTEGMFTRNTGNTRGHSLKLTKPGANRDIKKFYFTSRVIDQWNDLPESVVSAQTVNSFKNRLDRFWKDQPVKFIYTEPYDPAGRRHENYAQAQQCQEQQWERSTDSTELHEPAGQQRGDHPAAQQRRESRGAVLPAAAEPESSELDREA